MDNEIERKSKSQVKREMLALQALGEKLLALSADQIRKIEMPPELQEALLFCKTIKKGEARRRQVQYIGVIMREIDPVPLQKALDAIERGNIQDVQKFKEIELWRDELVKGNESVLEVIANQFPDLDRRAVLRLADDARREREKNKPPKASRALFRLLKALSGAR